jgi:hypothetical protein
MVTTVGTPQTVAAQELRIESMFPAEEETEREHLLLLGACEGVRGVQELSQERASRIANSELKGSRRNQNAGGLI